MRQRHVKIYCRCALMAKPLGRHFPTAYTEQFIARTAEPNSKSIPRQVDAWHPAHMEDAE